MYTIRNINKVYAIGEAQVVIHFSNPSPFGGSIESDETVIVPNGSTMFDSDLLAAVIAQHKLDPTTIAFDAYIPPPAPVETPPAS